MARKWLQSVDWQNVAGTGSDVLGALSGEDDTSSVTYVEVEKEGTPQWIYWVGGGAFAIVLFSILK